MVFVIGEDALTVFLKCFAGVRIFCRATRRAVFHGAMLCILRAQ